MPGKQLLVGWMTRSGPEHHLRALIWMYRDRSGHQAIQGLLCAGNDCLGEDQRPLAQAELGLAKALLRTP